VLIALLLATTVPLAVDPQLQDALGPIDPRPGAWAEYLIRTAGRDDLRLRATVLPAEAAGRYWLELAMAAEAGIASAARLLVRRDPAAGIESAHLMLAGQQPIQIPPDRLRPAVRKIPSMTRARRTRVRVRAGTFMADMFRAGAARVWRAPGVPLWGLVKARSKRQSIELIACGASGGRSVFPAGWAQGKGSESAK
jgi:hypothetical protein